MKHIVTLQAILMALVLREKGRIEISADELDRAVDHHSFDCTYTSLLDAEGNIPTEGHETVRIVLEVVSQHEGRRRYKRALEVAEREARARGGMIVIQGDLPPEPPRTDA